MDSEPIVINEADLQTKSFKRLKEPASGEKQTLDLDSDLYIIPGVPVKNKLNSETSLTEMDIPDEPHVLVVNELHVTDKNHRDLVLNQVPVMFAHGHRVDDEWRFANGQSVVETVRAWDTYAEINNLPQIEFVIACNEETEPDPLGIKIKDFDKDKVIAQAVGNRLSLGTAKINSRGEIIMEVIESGNDEIWGLEELKVLKEIEIE